MNRMTRFVAILLPILRLSPLAAETPATVSTAWLAERLGKEAAPVLVDARGTKAFLASHLPGAQVLAPENLRSSAAGVPGTLYPAEVLRIAAGRLGLGPGARAVVYSEVTDVDATYVATALRLAGVAEVAVLDGGWARWTSEKRPVTAERAFVPVVAGPQPAAGPSAIATIADVKRALETKGAVLVDARSAEQYDAGHLPGAKSRFWQKDVADGVFRPEGEVRAELEAQGIAREKPVIVYCNTGHQASALYWELKNRLGYADVKLYNGSWVEWAMTPGTPKESTPKPEPAK
jgi:thiosulfate/3-mercaptopyruvate sulfurtransferase